MTTFADTLFQNGGAPVGIGSGVTSKLFVTPTKGRAWYVDASAGTNGNGKSPKTAFNTMARAFSAIASGDIIYFVGKIQEQLITPVNVFDVTIVGCGNRPRHADATPTGGSNAAATWAAPATPTAATPLVQVLQQGWRFVNILFAGSAGCPSINLVRNAAAGDLERDASHAEIIGCRFAGVASTDIGIKFGATAYTEIVNNVLIQGCTFNGCATAIGQQSANLAYRAQIFDNVFQGNTSDLTIGLYQSTVKGNIFAGFTTNGINLTGGTSPNIVTGNTLSGTYSIAGGYVSAGVTDIWSNYVTAGITTALPA